MALHVCEGWRGALGALGDYLEREMAACRAAERDMVAAAVGEPGGAGGGDSAGTVSQRPDGGGGRLDGREKEPEEDDSEGDEEGRGERWVRRAVAKLRRLAAWEKAAAAPRGE